MARKVTQTLICDLPHEEETPAVKTVTFSEGPNLYEGEVCTQHDTALRMALAPYIQAARRAPATKAGPPPRTAQNRRDAAAMRSWAKTKGYKVSERGRIPVAIQTEYRATH